MKDSGAIINRVAQSGIITLNLENYLSTAENVVFDVKDYLFMNMILKEKDFRTALKEMDWETYRNKNVAICCTADAIVPVWAYMLVATKLDGIANWSVFGDETVLQALLFQQALSKIKVEEFTDKRVVIKGCGDKAVPAYAYVEITRLLKPVVKSLMYGEPCSTVPIYKQPRKK